MKKLMVVLSILAIVPFAQAQKKKKESLHDQFSGQGYGMAGCGLGSIVFGDKPGMIQIVAATVNGTGYQTIAITFGTSNCGESGKMAKASQFIDVNKVALENDISRGSGEALASLGIVMGCQNSDFSTQLRTQWVPGSPTDSMATVAANSCVL